ncbi:hypothetical protein [Vibrio phage BONAISHI]|nr:hypothetical protein [Vibrio phage BONAISHI]
MTIKVSSRKFIGVSRVAENKKRGSHIVEVYPREQLPTVDDAITPALQKVEFQGIDCGERPYSAVLQRGFTIPCKWLGSTNRATPPDVRRGERVNIYRDGDSQNYYWSAIGQDDHLRRLETVILTINANPDNSDVEPGPDNTWSIEMSSHEGHITLRTTQANNEKAAWILQFDCADGKFVVEDEKGMHFLKDSVNDLIRLQNQATSKIELNKKDINIFCEENININSKNLTQIIKEVIKTETKTITTQSESTSWNNSNAWSLETGTFTAQAQQSAELKAGSTVTIQGSSVFIN